MTRKEVRTILGEPARIVAFGVTKEYAGEHSPLAPMERWYFEYALSADDRNAPTPIIGAQRTGSTPLRRLGGAVEFASPDGTVHSWTEPDWSHIAPDK